MILDKLTEFGDSVAVTGAAGTRNLTDVIDIFAQDALTTMRDVGNGQSVYLYLLVETAPTGATTVEFQLISDSVNPPATDGSATTHWSSGATPIADLPDGTMFVIELPLEGAAYEQYLGVQVTNVGASPLAALVVSAGLTLDKHGWKAYPGNPGTVA